jgi:hypothetical protein
MFQQHEPTTAVEEAVTASVPGAYFQPI